MVLLGPLLVLLSPGVVPESFTDRAVEGGEAEEEDEKQGISGPRVGMQVRMI